MLTVVHQENEKNDVSVHAPAGVGGSLLDELVRDGARAMLAAALQAEVARLRRRVHRPGRRARPTLGRA